MAADECAAATDVLVRFLEPMLEQTPLPISEARKLAVVIGSDDGLLIAIDEGRAVVSRWRASEGPVRADTTIRFDSAASLRQVVADQGTSVPSLLLRRKIRLEGNMSWLEQMRHTFEGSGGRSSASRGEAEALHMLSGELDLAIDRAASSTMSYMSQVSMWLPDEASARCMCCSRQFTILLRRHHCRACGRLFCRACAPKRSAPCMMASFPSRGSNEPRRRICDSCVGGSLWEEAAPLPASFVGSRHRLGSDHSEGIPSSVLKMQREKMEAELEKLRFKHEEQTEAIVCGEIAKVWLFTEVALVLVSIFLFFWRYTALLIWLIYLLLLHLCPQSQMRRLAHVFWAGFVVFCKVYFTLLKCRHGPYSAKAKEAEWAKCHRFVGRFLYERMSRLRGFWPKMGQQISVNPAFPAQYQEELSKLQDSLPADPIEEVQATLRQEFGEATASKIKFSAQEPPLGTATIAQVHRATWFPQGSSKGEEIVVKVQHAGVERIFKQDLWSAGVFSHLLAYMDPEGIPDVRPIIKAFREVTLKELDFRLEAANQTRAAKTVKEQGVDVLIPEVVPALISRRAMAMSYVDGVRLSQLKQELPHVEPAKLIFALVDHFAVQFAVDGHFHADPHPGNLLVDKATGKLVVLDWGMCMTVSQTSSIGYANLFFATATNNCWGLVSAMKDLGFVFKEGDVFEPFYFECIFRFILRDSRPMLDARGEVAAAMEVGSELNSKGPQRYQKAPFSSFSGDMIYFSRALELLYSVSSMLDVQHPLLQTLLRRSQAALLQRRGIATPTPLPLNPQDFLPAMASAPTRSARTHLEQKLETYLRECYKNGIMMGMQLYVLSNKRSHRKGHGRDASCPTHEANCLADIALGVRSWLDPSAVTHDTLFHLLDISKLQTALAVLRLVDAKHLSLRDQLAEHWPGFGSNVHFKPPGGGQATVADALGHAAGMWDLLPPSVNTLEELQDLDGMLQKIAGMPVWDRPGTAQRYHHTTFGYLCAGMCKHLARKSFEAAAADVQHAAIEAMGGKDSSLGMACEQDLLLKLSGGRDACRRELALVQKPVTSAGMEEIEAMIAGVADVVGDDNDDDPTAGTMRRALGREHLFEPCLYSEACDVSAAVLPGQQSFATARAIAALLSATATGGVISERLLQEATTFRIPSSQAASGSGAADERALPSDELAAAVQNVIAVHEFREFGLGVQLMRPEFWAGGRLTSAASDHIAWGHLSQSGSAAFVLPPPLSMTVVFLSNLVDVRKESAEVARRVFQIVAETAPAEGHGRS